MQQERVRLDKWLWAARFYKTRALASEAINGGHVQVNNQRVKASKQIASGDRLEIRKTPYIYVITVTGLSEKRGSARIAATLFHEDEDSIARRDLLREQYHLNRMSHPRPDKRPEKHERRKLMRIRSKH